MIKILVSPKDSCSEEMKDTLLFNAHLQRGDLQGVLHQGGRVENDGLSDEGGLDGAGVEQVGVVADFAELHEDVYHRHEVSARQCFSGSVDEKENVSKGVLKESLYDFEKHTKMLK